MVIPPPFLWFLSFLIVVYDGILGVPDDGVSFVSCIVMISAYVPCMSCFSSLFLTPFMFIGNMMRCYLSHLRCVGGVWLV